MKRGWKMQTIPVYLFVGFLESGKTQFVQQTLCDPRFNAGEKTLLLVFEEGIEEYDPSAFSGKNVTIEYIDDFESLTRDDLLVMQKKSNAERVVVEYNGMLMISELQKKLPENWAVYQCMMSADATTFLNYNANMRSLVVDKLSNCEMVAFNRVKKGVDDINEFHKIVRGSSRRADIIYEYTDGTIDFDEIEDPLPFDLEADVVTIEDEDYALFYRDLMEDMKKYDGKTVKFKAVVARDNRMGKDTFAAGRHVMTCCVEDISYCAIVCNYKNASIITTGEWLNVTGKISVKFNRLYARRGPVIEVTEIAKTSEPKDRVATFF
ncbi:MAG: GTPase [Clostridia bacterium]|nr:GTPase [Clostridia bacterium]